MASKGVHELRLVKALRDAGVRVETDVKFYYASFSSRKYITPDIVLPDSKMVIEVDGHHHKTDPDQFIRDNQRDMTIKAQGYTVEHISNRDIMSSLDLQKVVNRILQLDRFIADQLRAKYKDIDDLRSAQAIETSKNQRASKVSSKTTVYSASRSIYPIWDDWWGLLSILSTVVYLMLMFQPRPIVIVFSHLPFYSPLGLLLLSQFVAPTAGLMGLLRGVNRNRVPVYSIIGTCVGLFAWMILPYLL